MSLASLHAESDVHALLSEEVLPCLLSLAPATLASWGLRCFFFGRSLRSLGAHLPLGMTIMVRVLFARKKLIRPPQGEKNDAPFVPSLVFLGK